MLLHQFLLMIIQISSRNAYLEILTGNKTALKGLQLLTEKEFEVVGQ